VRVVQLDSHFLGKRIPIRVIAPEASQEIAQRAGDKKIFLHEAQGLPHGSRVVGIEHTRERLGAEGLGQRRDEIAAAEFPKVEVIGSGGGPQPERIDILATVADDGAIKRHTNQSGRTIRDRA